MFQDNYITRGVFNIYLAPSKNTVTSPELRPKAKKKKDIKLKVIAAVEAKSKLVLNLKVTLNNSGLLILCIFIQAHNKVRKLQKKKEPKKNNLTHRQLKQCS